MPDRKKWQQAKANLVRGLRKCIADNEELLADLEWWNANRNDAEPFDVGGTRVAIKLAEECLGLVLANQRLPDDLWNRLQKQLEANAEA